MASLRDVIDVVCGTPPDDVIPCVTQANSFREVVSLQAMFVTLTVALLAYVNPNPTRFAADGTVVERGGGAAYAPTDKIPPALLAGARGAPP